MLYNIFVLIQMPHINKINPYDCRYSYSDRQTIRMEWWGTESLLPSHSPTIILVSGCIYQRTIRKCKWHVYHTPTENSVCLFGITDRLRCHETNHPKHRIS